MLLDFDLGSKFSAKFGPWFSGVGEAQGHFGDERWCPMLTPEYTAWSVNRGCPTPRSESRLAPVSESSGAQLPAASAKNSAQGVGLFCGFHGISQFP